MKRTILFTIFFTVFVSLTGQSIDKSKYSLIVETAPNTYLVAVGGKTDTGVLQGAKWGVVDETGRTLLAPKFDFIGDFVNGFAPVKQGLKYGFINKAYEQIIPCQYTVVGAFNEKGYVWVNQGGRRDDANPQNFIGGQFGVLNSDGKEVVPVKYKAIGTFSSSISPNANPFASFTAIPKHFHAMEKDAGSYNIHEYEYIEARFMSQLEMIFDDNIVVSINGNHEKDGIYSGTGQMLLPPGKFDMIYNPSEGMVPVSRFVNGELQANYYKIENAGLMFTNWVTVDCITPFKSSRAIMAVHDRNTFIDNHGHKLGLQYKIIFPSETGIYVVMDDKMKFGLIDNDGNEILSPSYAVIHPMREGKMVARKERDGLCGFINSDGSETFPAKYLSAMSFRNGLARVRSESGWGLINHKGENIISCRWFSIHQPTEENPEYLWVRKEKGGLTYCIKVSSDDYAFEEGFARARNFNEDFNGVSFVFNAKMKVGCINTDGRLLVPFVMNDVSDMRNTYSSMLKDGKEAWDKADEWRWNVKMKESTIIHKLNTILPETSWDF